MSDLDLSRRVSLASLVNVESHRDRLDDFSPALRWFAEVLNGYIRLHVLHVLKVTEHGVWVAVPGVSQHVDAMRHVPTKDWRTGFPRSFVWYPHKARRCHRTRRDALEGLLMRKKSHVRHAESRLLDAESQLESVECLLDALKGYEAARGAV